MAADAGGTGLNTALLDRVAVRVAGRLSSTRESRHPGLGLRLQQARIPSPPVAYLAGTYVVTAAAFAVAALPFLVYLLGTGGGANAAVAVPLAVVPTLAASAVYAWRLLRPDMVASARRSSIEENLPHAMHHMAALAGAGVLPARIFASIGREPVYGHLAREADLIDRDVTLLSRDLIRALRDAATRSPSPRWSEFLLGSVNTITSGGALKQYILAKSSQFEQEARRQQRAYLEGIGVMAESYVVVAAAAPLFLLIVLSVMSLISPRVDDPSTMLNVLVFLAMPVLHGAFTWILRNTTSS